MDIGEPRYDTFWRYRCPTCGEEQRGEGEQRHAACACERAAWQHLTACERRWAGLPQGPEVEWDRPIPTRWGPLDHPSQPRGL